MIRNKDYKTLCKNKHYVNLTSSELEESLSYNMCNECGDEIILVNPSNIEIACAGCGWENVEDWKDVLSWLNSSCPTCSEDNNREGDIHIKDSFDYSLEWYSSNHKELKTRNKRIDYWEYVIHFCELYEFISIFDNNIIKASNTGYFNVPAICLTETPILHSRDIRDVHGEYGICFKKSDIIKYGGAPALYITDNIIQVQKQVGFSDEIKPFVTLLRIPSTSPECAYQKKIDYLHEREWRVPKDIKILSSKSSYSDDGIFPVGLVFPEGSINEKFEGEYEEKLILLNGIYGEIKLFS